MNTQATIETYDPIQELEAMIAPLTGDEPKQLRVNEITEQPELFQPRDETLDEHHVSVLERHLGSQGKLDSILVLRCHDAHIVIDGHHRLEAYRRQGIPVIHVRYFQGNATEAVIAAGRYNNKAKLPLTSRERMNYAWRLVRMGRFSKAQISTAAAVSSRQVAIMRCRLKELGEDADSFPEWHHAQKHVASHQGLSTSEMKEWCEEQAQDRAERLAKVFGKKMGENPSITARALEIYLGRKFSEVTQAMYELLTDEEREVMEEEDDF